MKKLKRLMVQTIQCWKKDGALTQGAALSFYTITALPALLLGIFALSSFVLDKSEVQYQLLNSAAILFGERGLEVVGQILSNVPSNQTLTLTTLFSILFLLFTASGIFGQLQASLNRIWNVAPKPNQGIHRFFLNQALLFLMILLLGLLFISSIIFESIFSFGSHLLAQLVTLPFDVLVPVSIIISFLLLIVIFTLLFHLLPDAKISWKDSYIGAVFTTFLFTIGKFLIGFYLSHTNIASAYGAAGSVILLLMWIYYSSQVFFLGAEFTQNFSNTYGSKIKPTKHSYRTNSWWSKIWYRSE